MALKNKSSGFDPNAVDRQLYAASLTGAEVAAGGGEWLMGGAWGDFLYGGLGDDRLLGGSGRDTLSGGAGNDALDGGSGWDRAVFSGSVLNYSFVFGGDRGTAGNAGLTWQVTDLVGSDGSDVLRKVEELQFADRTIYLDGRNNTPYAVADRFALDEDQPLVLSAGALTANDWDFEKDVLRVASVEGALHGQVSLDEQGRVTFTADAHYSGAASFRYMLRDAAGNSESGEVTLDIRAVADAPELSVHLDDPVAAGGFANAVQTTRVAEVEHNNSLATAQSIARDAFVIAANPDLTDERDPSVSISGLIDGSLDRDYFRFEFDAGETAIFDIDYGKPDVDTVITLYDASGRQLAINDDFGLAHNWIDRGSSSPMDSYLSHTFAEDGDYLLMVKPYRTGGDYVLNVSIDDGTAHDDGPVSRALDIRSVLVDPDGSETLSFDVFGLPEGAGLSQGTRDGNGVWHLEEADLDGLQLTLSSAGDDFDLWIDAEATEASNGSTAHHVVGIDGTGMVFFDRTFVEPLPGELPGVLPAGSEIWF